MEMLELFGIIPIIAYKESHISVHKVTDDLRPRVLEVPVIHAHEKLW